MLKRNTPEDYLSLPTTFQRLKLISSSYQESLMIKRYTCTIKLLRFNTWILLSCLAIDLPLVSVWFHTIKCHCKPLNIISGFYAPKLNSVKFIVLVCAIRYDFSKLKWSVIIPIIKTCVLLPSKSILLNCQQQYENVWGQTIK